MLPLKPFWTVALLAAISLFGISPALAAGPKVEIVVGAKAPAIERFAGDELATQLAKLYGVETAVATKLPKATGLAKASGSLVLVGSPATNPAISSALGKDWPKLSDQGHLLKSTRFDGRTALVVGGGSPVATLWAAYELGYRLGIRYLLSGDVYPETPNPLAWERFDLLLEPNPRVRCWRTINDFAIGPESWGLEEHRRVLGQLAKLKFNRVMLACYPWQPFVDYEFHGVKKQTAMLWYGYRYRVDGDTPGRAAFHGVKEFTNPDMAGKATYAERTAAGIALVRGVLARARELGMSTGIAISPLEFPKEFAEVLPGASQLHSLESLVVGPGPRQSPDDPVIRELAATQIRAYLDTYPELDFLYLTLPEFPDWVEHYEAAWKRLDAATGIGRRISLEKLTETARQRDLVSSGERGVRALRGNLVALEFFRSFLADPKLLARADGTRVAPVLVDVDTALFPVLDLVVPPQTSALHFIDYTARRVAKHADLLAQVPSKKVPSSLILTLADDNVGVLPQNSWHDLHALSGQLRSLGWEGFSTRYWIVGDLDPIVHYLARASVEEALTPEAACDDLVTPMCGPDVAQRVINGLNLIERATMLIDERDLGFAFPVPGVVMKHYTDAGPPPDWWSEAATLYTGALEEFLRGNDRSLLPGRPFLRHLAKRSEFALEYLTSIQALRKAGEAKRAGDAQEHLALLEKAVEAMYNALSALGEVADDNSDRGVIAVLAEYGYRPLVAEFEAVEDATEK